MKVTVSEIPEVGIELELKERLSSEAVKVLSPVEAVLKIDKEGPDVLVRGVLSGDIELECSRCLKAFEVGIKSRMDIVFHPEVVNKKEESHGLRADELDTEFYKDDTLDVDNLLVEQLILNVPMKPLCSPECKGICPKCGTDLNLEQCNCETVEIDPRLKILETLLKRKE